MNQNLNCLSHQNLQQYNDTTVHWQEKQDNRNLHTKMNILNTMVAKQIMGCISYRKTLDVSRLPTFYITHTLKLFLHTVPSLKSFCPVN